MLSLALAALDCAAGVYLVLYAPHRERRDPDAVLAVGYFLTVCAVVLVGLELLLLGPDAVLRALLPMCGRPQLPRSGRSSARAEELLPGAGV